MRLILLFLLLIVGVLSVSSSGDQLHETVLVGSESMSQDAILNTLSFQVSEYLKRIDTSLTEASKTLENSNLSDSGADVSLQDLYESIPHVIDTITISSEGKILATYPKNLSYLIGENIGEREYLKGLLASKKAVMSPVFITIEGFPAVDIVHPVYSHDGEFMGGISLMMDEKKFFKDLITALDPDSIFEIFIMENDGHIVYDSNLSQIGENTFKSPLFQNYPDILELGQKMGNTTQGEGEYEYYNSEGVLVRKKALWDTVTLYGTDWNIIVSEETDQILNNTL